ncbi:hypothetical protein HN832_01305 [archaeon]|jgi:hypothetical protein|nr:hypothetical protein [archaeon]MBT4373909.1 hypothetical protein [archaeon]MBT4532186.1 hypothetical protein [archaeon]MBT7001139.1 hypothetical protein [archaeon]MBT7282028.1 hypothetical protein [archaeon]
MSLIPMYSIHETGYAFVEPVKKGLFGNRIRKTLRDLLCVKLSLQGYEVRNAKTSNLDSGVEKTLLIAEQIIFDLSKTEIGKIH